MELIVVSKEDLRALIQEAIAGVTAKSGAPPPDRWISGEECMKMLRISSRTTLQKLRDSGSIAFSCPSSRLFLYDRESILAFLTKHKQDIF